MPTATVYRDGKAIRTTTLTADQARDFTILAQGVRDAQNARAASGDDTTIYACLPKIAETLGQHVRAVYPHLDEAVNGPVLRSPDGSPEYGLKLAHKHTPIPAPSHPAQLLASQATTLGMVMADSSAFDYCELTDPPPAPVVTTGGAVVSHGNVPQLRASVRHRV